MPADQTMKAKMPANKLMKAEIPEAQIIKASSPSTLNPAFSLPSSKIPWLPDDVRVLFTAMALFVVLMLGLQWGTKVIAYPVHLYYTSGLFFEFE